MAGIPEPARGRAHPKTRADTLLVIVWSLFLGVLFPLVADSFVEAPKRDSAAFLYVARGILEGETPYLDRWDHKGPVVYIINAAGLLLSKVWGVWLVQLGFLVWTCLAAGTLLRAQFGTVAALFSLTVLLVSCLEFLDGGNMTEQYALLFQFMALALFVRVERNSGNSSPARLLLTLGALGGMAFLLRPNLTGVWVAIGLSWLVDRDDTLRKLGWAAAGGLTVLGVFVAWFTLAGGLFAFWDAVIVYNMHYSDAPLRLKYRAAAEILTNVSLLTVVLPPSWFVGLYHMVSGSMASRGFGPLGRLAVVLLPIEVVFVALSGYEFDHYSLALIPVACLLSACAVSLLLDKRGGWLPWILGALCCVAGFMTVYDRRGHLLPDVVDKYSNLGIHGARGEGLLSYIREHTAEGDTILVWGGESLCYVASGRAAPTRFFYSYPLIKQGYASPELLAEFTADVVAHPPVLIVDTHGGLMPPLRMTDAERVRWRPLNTRYAWYAPDQFRPFFEFVDARYDLKATIGKREVYHLRGPALERQEER